jgi:hypothetical protein
LRVLFAGLIIKITYVEFSHQLQSRFKAMHEMNFHRFFGLFRMARLNGSIDGLMFLGDIANPAGQRKGRHAEQDQ